MRFHGVALSVQPDRIRQQRVDVVKRGVVKPERSRPERILEGPLNVAQRNSIYRAAFETHHVAHIEEFDNYQAAASFLHGWSRDVHTWPVAIHEPARNRLWLWCGYRTLGVSRESALADARGIFGLPQDYGFAAVEMMAEDV